MHYMIYVPQAALPANKGGDAKAVLAHVGLADICDGSPVLSPVVDHGPDDGPGVLICWGGAGFVKLAQQTWKKCPGHAFYVGTGSDGKVDPMALAREQSYKGYNCKLADGQQWIVPVARQFPRRYEMQEDGMAAAVLAGDFAEFFDFAFDVVLEKWLAEEVDPSHTDVCKFCARALAFNYRLTYEIAMALGLFDELAYKAVAHAVCDVPALEAMWNQKKTAESVDG